MKKIFLVLILFTSFLAFGQEKAKWYTDFEKAGKISVENKKPLFVFLEDNGLWGVKNNNCKQVSFETNNSYVGKDHIHIKWNASKCNYIAIGLKWANYKVKNLEPIIESAAIELHVRIDSGELSNTPMFFILVDYGGNQCRAKINYLDIEGGKIDTEWRRIRIPLQSFNYKKRGVNMSNIKELRLEFQRLLKCALFHEQ